MSSVRFLRVLGYVFMVIYPLGAMMKIMHWPLAGLFMLFGALGGSISFILYYFLKEDQSFYDRSLIVIIPMICLSLLIRILPDDFSTIAISIALLISGSFLIFWTTKFVNSGPSFRVKEINWERFFYVIGAVLVFVGIILKYKYLPNARYFLIGGLVVLAGSYIIGFFSEKSLED
jgi:hypothetical protein